MPTNLHEWPRRTGSAAPADPAAAQLSDEELEHLYRGAACECCPELLADADPASAPRNHLRLPRRRPAAYLGVAIVLVALAFALAGCGGGEDEDTTGHDKTTQPLDCAHYPELCR